MVPGNTYPVLHAYMFLHFNFLILPPQEKNKRDFSLAGVLTVSKRASISVDILSKIIFINRNSIVIQSNQTTDVFQGQVEDLNIVTDLME